MIPELPATYLRHWINCPFEDVGLHTDEAMRAYATQCATMAVERERERCAKMADEYATWGGSNWAAAFAALAADIREQAWPAAQLTKGEQK